MLLWAGCQTAEPPVAPDAIAIASDRLLVGMYTSQVEGMLGSPQSIESTPDGATVTWTYQIDHLPLYRTIVAEMIDVPWVDPITGEMKSVAEPVTDQQRIDRRELLELDFRHDQLIRIRRDLTERREFSR